MPKTTLTGPRGELVIEREVIPVNYLSDMDANWTFTDAHGHEHYCDYEAADHYPTLTRVIYETYWCEECEDEHDSARLECRLCGETIRPGTTGPGTKFIPGVITATFNGEEITAERAQQIAAEWSASRG
jgi:hypothetical protein